MATQVSVNFIWVDSNNEWQIPEDWDPHLSGEPVSENLNEVAEYWSNTQNLEFIAKKFISPPEFLTDAEFDSGYLNQMLEPSSNATQTIQLLPRKWIELGNKLRALALNPSVIAVPNKMTPWAWYELTEDERLSQMGLSESESLRADGVLYSDFNSFYFDTYRFGFFTFNLTEEIELKDIVDDPRFILYANEIVKRGPDSGFHSTCDEKCAFRPCSRMLHFPASIEQL